MEKQVVIDINDPRSGKIAETLANPSCKKILNILAENEMSASDISGKLKLPLNTITYNLDKLIESGLIEKTGQILWSIKGKQIPKYKISNRKIVISPKSLTAKGIIPAILGTAIIAAGIKYFFSGNIIENSYGNAGIEMTKIAAPAMDSAFDFARETPSIINTCSNFAEPWIWFILGSLITILIFLIWNLKGGKEK
jgi:DNA-binding transcriptional ArsR family regulator